VQFAKNIFHKKVLPIYFQYKSQFFLSPGFMELERGILEVNTHGFFSDKR